MAFFGLFRGKERSSEELRQEAQAVLREVDQLTVTNPKAALKRFYNAFEGGDLEPFADFESPLHDDVQRMLDKVTGRSSGILPPVVVCDDPEPADWNALIERAGNMPEGLGYVRFMREYGGHRCALAGMEAQRLMADDEPVSAVFAGESYVLLRNPVAVQFARQLAGPLTRRALQRDFDDIMVRRLGHAECESWDSPLGYEMFVYRTAGNGPA